MKTIEEPVNGRTVINVKMASDTETLGEVVVTAMGIKRQSETLTYSAQTVGGKDVNDIKSVNMINSLQGKSAGMMITPKPTVSSSRRSSCHDEYHQLTSRQQLRRPARRW